MLPLKCLPKRLKKFRLDVIKLNCQICDKTFQQLRREDGSSTFMLKAVKDDEDDDIEIIKAVTAGEANSRADDQLPPS